MTNAARHTLYPRRYRRSARAKSLGHVAPAVVLASGVLPLLTGHEPLTVLLALEIAVGAAYLVLMARELWHLRHPAPHHERVAWLELAAAGILGLEGYHIWHRHHERALATGEHRLHILPWLYFGVAGVFVGMAFGTARVLERRYLHLHDEGFAGQLRLWGRPFAFNWADVRAVEPVGSAGARVHLREGVAPVELSFAHLHDGTAHRDHLVAQAQPRVIA